MQRVVWSSKGRAVVALLACALTASVLVAQPRDALRRELAREAPNPSETVCEGGVVSMEGGTSTPPTYVGMYIPAGAKARFRAAGEILPSTYVGNGRGEYVMNVRVWRPDTGTAIWDDWNYAGVGIVWGSGPYDWVPFSTRTLGEYTNNTGAGRNFIVEFWANRSYAGAGLRWDAWANIDDGAGVRSAICFPVDPSELISCNPAIKNGCVQVDAADPVNTYSGAFHDDFVDIAPIPGRGPTLAAQRFYNTALSDEPGAYGRGWRHNYDLSVTGPDGNGMMKVTQENGTTVFFRDNGAGAWESPSRSDATLEALPDGGWRFVRRDHQIFEFTPTGVLARIRDRNGYETTLDYSDGLLDTVTDPAGRSLSYTWTGTGADARITQVTDPSTPARTVTFGYDGSGRLTSVTDVAGGVWRYDYDTDDRIVSVTKPRQEQLTGQPSVLNVYDTAGRVVSQTDEEGQTTLFDYTSEPNATIVTDPEGNKTKYVYDEFRLIASVTKGYQSATPSTWTYTHNLDTFGVTKIVDPNGKLTKATYDADGDRTSITDPLNRTAAWTYNDLDQVLTETDPNGIATTYTYDPAGNPLSVSRPLTDQGGVIATATTTLGYGDSAHPGDVTEVTDPIGQTTSLVYDTAGNPVQSVAPATAAAPDGAVTTMTYNEIGWLESIVSPRGNLPGAVAADFTTSYTRNSFGDVLIATAPDGATSSTDYDANRNVVTVTDANANTTEYTYGLVDRPVSVLRADGTATETSYTGTGMTASTTDAAGSTTTYTYDAQDRLVSSADPLGRATAFAYDPAGNLTTKTAPGPVATTFGYDAANQLLSIDHPGGATPDEQYTYDKLGRKVTATRRTGTIFQTAWAYDSLGRMTSESASGGDVITYGYDLAGQLTSISHPDDAGTVTRTYNAHGQLETVTDWHLRTFRFDYDADGDLVGQQNPNGTSTVIDVDQAGTTTGIVHNGAAGIAGAFAQFGYVRDGNGQITGLTETGVPASADTYGYDPLNRAHHREPGHQHVRLRVRHCGQRHPPTGPDRAALRRGQPAAVLHGTDHVRRLDWGHRPGLQDRRRALHGCRRRPSTALGHHPGRPVGGGDAVRVHRRGHLDRGQQHRLPLPANPDLEYRRHRDHRVLRPNGRLHQVRHRRRLPRRRPRRPDRRRPGGHRHRHHRDRPLGHRRARQHEPPRFRRHPHHSAHYRPRDLDDRCAADISGDRQPRGRRGCDRLRPQHARRRPHRARRCDQHSPWFPHRRCRCPAARPDHLHLRRPG